MLGLLLPSVRARRQTAAAVRFAAAHADWVDATSKRNKVFDLDKKEYAADVQAWEQGKLAFEDEQRVANAEVDDFRQRYRAKDKAAVEEYIDLILSQSDYPQCFPKQSTIAFTSETGVTIVDYELPPVDKLPALKAVKYIQSRDALDEVYLKEHEIGRIYDNAMYQTALRTIHEVMISDEADAITSITFNGWVSFTDRSNGKPSRSCILSVQCTKQDFAQLNLAEVDPKACFRALKGVGSASLAGMAPVVPILRLNKADDRFVPAHDAIAGIEEATNIAAIPWEEFEYLVRDIFEKEFSSNGGEVKITRASRDHGVDAIAFDPDPIRGGKIVIQAKRYTNVVGVSAVRDLYGTLINEGASRGILVTTSQYGADSYAFAKNKPLTLLDGGNLLSLLERHGHPARIDLAEAKKLGTSRDSG